MGKGIFASWGLENLLSENLFVNYPRKVPGTEMGWDNICKLGPRKYVE